MFKVLIIAFSIFNNYTDNMDDGPIYEAISYSLAEADCRINETHNSCIMACMASRQWINEEEMVEIMPACDEIFYDLGAF